ncbi:MAG TPA: ScyD/ScyE family protein [Pyrinomonadaceae bacterium]|nr:ScyD/ScyE family protein [Pyrinomonadaceae bacterium]
MNIQRKLYAALATIFSMVALAGFWSIDQPAGAARNAGLGTVTTIASGLNNPRGLNFAPDGALMIAEAGSGGAGPCGPGPEGDRCFGRSGSITRIDRQTGMVTRTAINLPSLATPDGSFATGVHDISFQGLGNTFLTTGFAGDPADRALNFGAAGQNFARLARINPGGRWSLAQDLGEYEQQHNPTGDEVDSNPYGVLALAGKTIYTDAGGNTLNQISARGVIRTLATFPNREVPAPPFLDLPPGTLIPMDTVPTSVAQGPDGSFYVGQLTGFPFPVDDANVYRVPSDGGAPEIAAGNFTAVIDVAFGADGSMYVLELAKNGLLAAFEQGDWTGALVRVAPDGTRTEIAEGMLTAPGGVAVGNDGALYVTNNSISSGVGQVLRITQ